MEILNKTYVIKFPGGEKWAVPISAIAEHRAKLYADEFGGDITKSVMEDTAPLFDGDHYEIEDWAKNNMNWVDVMGVAKLLTTGITDYQDGWVNGEAEVL